MTFRCCYAALSFAILVAGLVATPCCFAEGLVLTADDTTAAVTSITVPPTGSIDFGLRLLNDSSGPTDLTAAQAALVVRPLDTATGGFDITAGASESLFGTGATGIASADGSVVTIQTGAPAPATITARSLVLLSRINLAASEDANGEFELIALEFDPLNLLTSSHWRPPGGLGLPFPRPTPYRNLTAGSGDLVLARITVALPEPGSGFLLGPLLMIGLSGRSRRSLMSQQERLSVRGESIMRSLSL